MAWRPLLVRSFPSLGLGSAASSSPTVRVQGSASSTTDAASCSSIGWLGWVALLGIAGWAAWRWYERSQLPLSARMMLDGHWATEEDLREDGGEDAVRRALRDRGWQLGQYREEFHAYKMHPGWVAEHDRREAARD